MQFGLGIDGVVLLFVAYRHVGRVVAEDGGDDLTGPSLSMLLGMWTTAATFYGLAVVDFPSLEVTPDPQRYTRLGPSSYRFDSLDSDFTAELTVDDDSIVVTYPELFERQ
jgi:hypothetical protein